MKSLAFAATFAASTALALPTVAATFAGFETGDLAGWTAAGGPAEVVTTADDYYQVERYAPTEGDYFARLTAGETVGSYTTLTRLFSLATASVVSFDAAFLAFDDADHNDDGYVRIANLATHDVFSFSFSVADVGQYGSSPWRTFSQSLGVGAYAIEAGVRNIGDAGLVAEPGYDSQLLIDNVSAAVPEPEGWALLIVGFAGLGMALRGRRSVRGQAAWAGPYSRL